jgi:hypothetical protein
MKNRKPKKILLTPLFPPSLSSSKWIIKINLTLKLAFNVYVDWKGRFFVVVVTSQKTGTVRKILMKLVWYASVAMSHANVSSVP